MADISKWFIIGGLGVAGLIIYKLVEQMLKAKGEITIEKYYCPACGAGPFDNYDDLVKHYQQAHPEIPEVPIEQEKKMDLKITNIYADGTQIY